MATDLIDRVGTGFRAAFGRDAEGVWSAPGRVSCAGDHTDVQDGLSFGFAIGRRTAVAVARRDDGAITVATDLTDERGEASLATLDPDSFDSDWRAYPLGMVWAVADRATADAAEAGVADAQSTRAGIAGTGLDIFLSTDLPVGGGLASSASVCAALGVALRELWRLELGDYDLAELGHATEVRVAGASAGIADHMLVLSAKAGHDVFFDARGRDTTLIPVPEHTAAGIDDVVVDTRSVHRNWSDAIHDRHLACARVATELGRQSLREVRRDELDAARDRLDEVDFRRAGFVVDEIQRTLDLTRILRTEGPSSTGEILNASQRALRDEFEVSSERLDEVCAVAAGAGAIGARMSGSGLGGSVLVVIPRERRAEFERAVTARFAELGWDEPEIFDAVAADGARREV